MEGGKKSTMASVTLSRSVSQALKLLGLFLGIKLLFCQGCLQDANAYWKTLNPFSLGERSCNWEDFFAVSFVAYIVNHRDM